MPPGSSPSASRCRASRSLRSCTIALTPGSWLGEGDAAAAHCPRSRFVRPAAVRTRRSMTTRHGRAYCPCTAGILAGALPAEIPGGTYPRLDGWLLFCFFSDAANPENAEKETAASRVIFMKGRMRCRFRAALSLCVVALAGDVCWGLPVARAGLRWPRPPSCLTLRGGDEERARGAPDLEAGPIDALNGNLQRSSIADTILSDSEVLAAGGVGTERKMAATLTFRADWPLAHTSRSHARAERALRLLSWFYMLRLLGVVRFALTVIVMLSAPLVMQAAMQNPTFWISVVFSARGRTSASARSEGSRMRTDRLVLQRDEYDASSGWQLQPCDICPSGLSRAVLCTTCWPG